VIALHLPLCPEEIKGLDATIHYTTLFPPGLARSIYYENSEHTRC